MIYDRWMLHRREEGETGARISLDVFIYDVKECQAYMSKEPWKYDAEGKYITKEQMMQFGVDDIYSHASQHTEQFDELMRSLWPSYNPPPKLTKEEFLEALRRNGTKIEMYDGSSIPAAEYVDDEEIPNEWKDFGAGKKSP